MMAKKKVKTITDKLTKRHHEAMNLAINGDCLPLINLIREARKAELKALKAVDAGARNWGTKTAAYYLELQEYLIGYIADINLRKTVAHSIENMELSNGQ